MLARPHRVAWGRVNCKVKPPGGALLWGQVLRTLVNWNSLEESGGHRVLGNPACLVVEEPRNA